MQNTSQILSESIGSVLDKGEVILLDHMGNDQRIVDAARVSYRAGTKKVREDDALINYLLKNKHWSPFEQVVFTFRIKAPLFVTQQFLRYRTARFNQESARYSILQDEFYWPSPSRILGQDAKNKQGSSTPLSPEVQEIAAKTIENQSKAAYALYTSMLNMGVAREIARIILPANIYTSFYWQIDLRNLFNFLSQRLDPHAQWEIQEYARNIKLLAQPVCPIAFAAFDKN